MKRNVNLILISIILVMFSIMTIVGCAKTQKKKPEVQKEYTEYEKKQKEFEQTKHTARSIDEINDIGIEATLVSTNKDGKKYFVKSEGSTSLLDAGFKKLADNEKEQKLFFRLSITEEEYKNFKKEYNTKYERLIEKINLELVISQLSRYRNLAKASKFQAS